MSDNQEIESLVQTYFESMFEASASKVHAVFHPDAKVTGYIEGELHTMTTSEFADFVDSHQPSAKDNGETPRLELISIDTAGETALVRVRCDYLGLTFLDSLSLLKTEGKWSIYNKLFHVEGPAG